MSSRSWFWAVAFVLAASGPAAAQAPSPLELVRGLRESGMPDLALDYLKEIEGKLTDTDKAAVPLERAKCLLESAEVEPDEGTRTSMVGEAKEGFNTFLASSANHPRASEASLALARLASIEAKAQLNRGRRMEVPPKDDPGYDEAIKKQREEMLKARPKFLDASKRFADAAKQLKDKLNDPNLDPATKLALGREVFDADLAAALNKYYLADTFLVTGSADTLERDKYLEEARATFAELAKGPPTSRTVWIGKAWMAEVLADQGKNNDATTEFTAIINTPRLEAEEGKRLVRFFQIRRKYLAALPEPTVAKLGESESELRSWLARYGNLQKPTPEVLAARYYLAFDLQLQAQIIMGPVRKDGTLPPLSDTARTKLKDSEKWYRGLGQSDHDYTARANRNRMIVVRRLLGEAERPPSTYVVFEEAQMAALIQMAKLNDAEKTLEKAKADAEDPDSPFWFGTYQKANVIRTKAEVGDRKHHVVALLERARELATDKDSPGDVTDNLLRLVYFYQNTDQPYQAAILGEYIARTIKTTGGKSAVAGLMALNGYTNASARIKAESSDDPTKSDAIAAAIEAAKKTDRERAIVVARFLDEKFPNDTATDAARHRLAYLLYEEKKYGEAFDIVVKVRPGYAAINNARLFEGALAAVLIASKDAAVTDERKRDVYRRAIADLSRLTPPGATATEDDVRGYVSCQLRLAQLFLSQYRVDPENEKKKHGVEIALDIADRVIGSLPTFERLLDKDKKLNLEGLNLHGAELKLQAFDLRTRALYLRAKELVDEKKFDDAAKAIDPVVADVAKGMMYDDRMRKWAGGQGDEGDDETAAGSKAKIAGMASGIDKIRRDIVMVGFKLRCVQGNKEGAAAMLNTLKKAGGGVEANQAALEQMARELAAQIQSLRKEGKKDEAQALGDGLAILLKEFTGIKDLPIPTILFLGNTFHTVGQHDEAIKEFNKIKVPTVAPEVLKGLIAKDPMLKPDAQWWEIDPNKIDDPQTRKKLQDEIRDYRFAQLYLAKAYRGAGKFAEAEALLTAAIGPPAKPNETVKKGYAYGSLDFRKELGSVYEAKAATLTDAKAAKEEWGKAQQAWSFLYNTAQNSLIKRAPDTPPDQLKRLQNNFFEAYFEVQRVLVTANTQLIKDPAALAKNFDPIGRNITKLETANNLEALAKKGEPLMTPEVAFRYWELIEKNPTLKNAYKTAGGKFFLDKPKLAE